MIDVLKRLRELDAQNPNIVKENQNQLIPGKFYVVGSEDSRGGNPQAVAGPFDDEGNAEYEKAEYSQGGREGVAVAQWTGKDWNFDYMMEPQKEGIMDKIKGAFGGETEEEKQARLKREFEKRKAARPENQPSKTDTWGDPGRAPEKRGNLEECGMMPPTSHSHSPASISMSADSGSELSTMLKDIMTLAGMQKPEHDHGMSSPMPMGGADGVAVVDVEPMSGPGMDVDEPSVMRSMLDKLNPEMDDEEEETDENASGGISGVDNTPADPTKLNPYPKNSVGTPGTQDPAGDPGVGDRMDGDRPKAFATFESLMKEYRKFMSESSEEGMLEGIDEDLRSDILEVLITIYHGAAEGEDMTDNIADELGDFYDAVEESDDAKLKKVYEYVRGFADEEPDIQASAVLKAMKQLQGKGYTPPPPPPPLADDDPTVQQFQNALTGALASRGMKTHPDWNKENESVDDDSVGEDIVYISKTKVEDFKDWMESEGFNVPRPVKWTDTHAVFDFRNADNYTKMYADEWNEKRHDNDEHMSENINDILRLSGLK